MTDVLIAGGGVAGSSLALLLGRAGYRVRLFEKSRYPREKVCGEGLMPAGVQCLHEAGIEAEGHPFHGIRYHKAGKTAVASFRQGPGLGVRRVSFDGQLFQMASRHAEVRRGRKGGGASHGARPGGWPRGGWRSPSRGADGGSRWRAFFIAPKLGDTRSRGAQTFRLACALCQAVGSARGRFLGPRARIVCDAAARRDRIRGSAGASGFLSRESERHTQPCDRHASAIGREPCGQPQLEPAAGASSWHVTPAVRHAPGFLLHGDAAGYVDPITGGGMTQALLTSRLVAAAFREGIPNSLEALDRERRPCCGDDRRA